MTSTPDSCYQVHWRKELSELGLQEALASSTGNIDGQMGTLAEPF